MYTGMIIIVISLFWFISEILLARLKRSGTKESPLDKASLKFIWITIILSVSIGVTFGAKGIGYISTGHEFISLLGLCFIVMGLAVRWMAIMTLKKYFTADVSIASDQQIIRKGIYKTIRHPAYSGSLLSFLGLGLSFANWLSTFIIFIPISAAFIYRIRVEEKALVSFFGDAYVRYSAKTKQLIPKIY